MNFLHYTQNYYIQKLVKVTNWYIIVHINTTNIRHWTIVIISSRLKEERRLKEKLEIDVSTQIVTYL